MYPTGRGMCILNMITCLLHISRRLCNAINIAGRGFVLNSGSSTVVGRGRGACAAEPRSAEKHESEYDKVCADFKKADVDSDGG